MATTQRARPLQRRQADELRARIDSATIITRFQKHVKGEIELTQTQISAGNSLLDRCVPKLQTIQHSGDENNPIRQVNEITVNLVGSKPA